MIVIDLLGEAIGYTVVTGFVAFWLIVALCALLYFWSRARLQPFPLPLATRAVQFFLLLGLAGALGDLVWLCLFPSSLVAGPDHICSFSPLCPPDTWTAAVSGGADAASVLWALISLAVLVCSLLLLRFVPRRAAT